MRSLILTVCATLCVQSAFAAPGDLDPTFAIPTPPSQSFAVVIQPDGKIIASGFNIIRYLPGGAIDTVFGGATPADGFFSALALQPDGKVVVAGGANVGEGYVLRFLPDGSPDPTFTPSYPGGNVTCVTILPDGRILAGGFFYANGRANLTMLLPDGQVDAGFSGEVTASSVVHSVAAQPDGRVIVGWSHGITRFLGNGVVDPSFAVLSVDFGAREIVLLPDGRILVGAGVVSDAQSNSRSGLVRLLADGQLDLTFTTEIASGGAVCLAVQPWDGRILAGGIFDGDYVARFLPDGARDTTFDVPINGPEDNVNGIAVQYDGKAIVAGYLELPTPHLVRLQNGAVPATLVFQTPSYRVLENAGSASIGVVRYGDASAASSVSYITWRGTAQPFHDYLPAFGTLQFAPGQRVKTFNVRILDDRRLNEPDETVNLFLYRARGGATLGPLDQALLRIIDNDID